MRSYSEHFQCLCLPSSHTCLPSMQHLGQIFQKGSCITIVCLPALCSDEYRNAIFPRSSITALTSHLLVTCSYHQQACHIHTFHLSISLQPPFRHLIQPCRSFRHMHTCSRNSSQPSLSFKVSYACRMGPTVIAKAENRQSDNQCKLFWLLHAYLSSSSQSLLLRKEMQNRRQRHSGGKNQEICTQAFQMNTCVDCLCLLCRLQWSRLAFQ